MKRWLIPLTLAIATILFPFTIAFWGGFLFQRDSGYGNATEISFTDFQKYINEDRISKNEPLQLIVTEERTAQTLFTILWPFSHILPTSWVVSVFNNHPSKVGIFILNLLLGWTVIGWIIALVWAVTKPQPPQQVIASQNMPPCPNSLQHSDD